MAGAAMMTAYPLLLTLFGSAPGHDALDSVPTSLYWSSHGGELTAAQLKTIIDAAPAAAPNFDQDIADLSSDQFKVRTRARQNLAAAGPAAIEKLRPLVSSKDPDVAQVAQDLITQASTSLRYNDIRRLMAIRTLGEKKDASALPLLQPLAASKDLFVADYAARASALIQGKPYSPPTHEKELAADLALIPKDTQILGQIKALALDPIMLDEVITDAAMFANPNGPRAAANPPPQDAIDAMAKFVLNFFDAGGDFRVDGLTIAVNPQADGGPWTELILHGAYDAAAVQGAVGATPHVPIDSITAAVLDPGITLLLPNPQTLIVVFAPDPAPFAAALHDPAKAGLSDNAPLAALLKKTDTAAPFWAIGQVGPLMKTIPMFAAFDTISFTSKRNDDGSIAFSAAADAADPKAAADAAASVNTQAAAAAAQMGMEINNLPFESAGLTPLMELMSSIKATTDGAHASLAGVAPHTLSHFTAMGAAAAVGGEQRTQEMRRRRAAELGQPATAP